MVFYYRNYCFFYYDDGITLCMGICKMTLKNYLLLGVSRFTLFRCMLEETKIICVNGQVGEVAKMYKMYIGKYFAK